MNDSSELKKNFSLVPADAILALEAEEHLENEIEEVSPLRREIVRPLPLVWDTRELANHRAPCLFVARRGHRFDGHSVVEDVLSQGHIVIAEEARLQEQLAAQGRPEIWIGDLLTHPFLILVKESEAALQALLDRASGMEPESWTSIAVTGTSGKTSVTQIAGALLGMTLEKPVLRLGTLGLQVGQHHWEGAYPTMPDYPGFVSALTLAREHGSQHAIFEATSHGLVEQRMSAWQVDVAVFTNFSQDHLDFHKTMEAYRTAKGILFERHMKPGATAVINADDLEWNYFLKKTRNKSAVIGYGGPTRREEFQAQAKSLGHSVRYLEFRPTTTSHEGIEGVWKLWNAGELLAECEYGSLLLGSFQHANLAAAVAALLATGQDLERLAELSMQMPMIPGRLEPISASFSSGPTVIIDYAHKPDALEKALGTLKGLVPSGGRLVSVFGCGGDRDSSKRPIMGRISEKIADVTFVTSDNPRSENPETIIDGIMAGLENPQGVVREADRRKAILGAILGARDCDIVVIAGKGHEDYQIIGTEKIHFSDHEEALRALQLRAERQQGMQR